MCTFCNRERVVKRTKEYQVYDKKEKRLGVITLDISDTIREARRIAYQRYPDWYIITPDV